MTPKYAKGYRNERKAKLILRKKGYLVFRSAGSKGPFDLLAIGKDILLIQVKTNRSPGKPEMQRLVKTKVHPACRKELWIFHDRVKDPEIIEIGENIYFRRNDTN